MLQLYLLFSNVGATTDKPLGNDTVHGLNYTKSYPCPPGYYCPSGNTLPIPCPNGTYYGEQYGQGLYSCIPCPVNHYNHLTGQTACFHCGGQASQPSRGQQKCICNGLRRVFMVSLSIYLYLYGYIVLIETGKSHSHCPKEGQLEEKKIFCYNKTPLFLIVMWGMFSPRGILSGGMLGSFLYSGFKNMLLKFLYCHLRTQMNAGNEYL